ncbi:MAG: hypothetical protein N2035_06500 [Chthoniobacterales bacterium]|nr:hypothetical protein [Chthoniobacterales bacterium]
MALTNDWEIQTPSHQCKITGQKFQEGQIFYTLLFREENGFRREDLCEEAWKNYDKKKQAFSLWKSKYNPPPPRTEPIPTNNAESLLRQLIQENNPQTRNVRYILAVMLERKRTLRPQKSSDSSVLVYQHAKTGEVFVIEDPKLKLEQLPIIQREVVQLLNQSLHK